MSGFWTSQAPVSRHATLTGDELRSLVLSRQTTGALAPNGVGPEAVELLGRALEPSTSAARATHMTALHGFMKLRQREFPLRDQDVAAFVGSLYGCIVTKRDPQLRAVSLPGYLSGIRRVHAALGLGSLLIETESLLLAAAAAGYEKAADGSVQPNKVRVGMPVHVLYKIMQLALAPTASTAVWREAALWLTIIVLGLRSATVEGLLPAHVTELSPARWQLLISILTGMTVEQALRRDGRDFYAPPPNRG